MRTRFARFTHGFRRGFQRALAKWQPPKEEEPPMVPAPTPEELVAEPVKVSIIEVDDEGAENIRQMAHAWSGGDTRPQ